MSRVSARPLNCWIRLFLVPSSFSMCLPHRRLKTEFMVQLDGANGNPDCHVFLLAATNRPWEIDDAILRRLSKKIYIPLPDPATRKQLIGACLRGRMGLRTAAGLARVYL